jgi:hypothetical protein
MEDKWSCLCFPSISQNDTDSKRKGGLGMRVPSRKTLVDTTNSKLMLQKRSMLLL